ncbi:hypothetical protein BCON_0821g00010 [Botryotinia convoluta]|uniref:Uncharacterized protein n=1 Tax=Botryotinia convoluta TaxID=54673 RepID=A0A4Z1H5K9_9HELO|nr:hypothetical protein BCON_0821g00010 [Botryotinia convoluta]
MIKSTKVNKKNTKILPDNPVVQGEEVSALHCVTLKEQLAFVRMMKNKKIRLSTKLNVQGKAKPKTHHKITTGDSPSNLEEIRILWKPEHSTISVDLSTLLPSLLRRYQTVITCLTVDHGNSGIFCRIGAILKVIDIFPGGIITVAHVNQNLKIVIIGHLGIMIIFPVQLILGTELKFESRIKTRLPNLFVMLPQSDCLSKSPRIAIWKQSFSYAEQRHITMRSQV